MKTLLLITLSFFVLNSINAQKIFVDSSAAGANTGLTWQDAFNDLQLAIDSAEAGDTICIAQGTYYPSILPRNCVNCDSTRDISFHFKDSVQLYGGYSSGGVKRNWKKYETILSGDIGVKNDSTDNSYHVAILSQGSEFVIIDGLIFQNGLGDGPGSVTIGGKTIIRSYGGGLYLSNSNIVVQSCKFRRNITSTGGGTGSGLYSTGDSDVLYCIFESNRGRTGAGFAVSSGDPLVYKCIFKNNQVTGAGGGMYTSLSSAHLYQCQFINNSSNVSGGALSDAQSNLRVESCEFIENQAPVLGGGVLTNSGTSKYINCIFYKNSSGSRGGGMYCGKFPKILNCTFVGNSASGSADLFVNHDTTHVTNSIFRGPGTRIGTGASGGVFVNYSIVSGGYPGVSNLDLDPKFVDSLNQDFAISGCSPALDAGRKDSLSIEDSLDYDQNARVIGNVVDIGAFEYQGDVFDLGTCVYVDSTGGVSAGGNDWNDAIPNLRSAIQTAKSCDVDSIKIAKGTYYLKSSFLIANKDSFWIIGGYPTDGGAYAPESNGSRISGDVGVSGDMTDNTNHLIIINEEVDFTEIRSIQLRDGYANGCEGLDLTGSALLLFSRLYMYDSSIENHFNTFESPIYTIPGSKLYMIGCTIRNNISGTGTTFSHAPLAEIFIDISSSIE